MRRCLQVALISGAAAVALVGVWTLTSNPWAAAAALGSYAVATVAALRMPFQPSR